MAQTSTRNWQLWKCLAWVLVSIITFDCLQKHQPQDGPQNLEIYLLFHFASLYKHCVERTINTIMMETDNNMHPQLMSHKMRAGNYLLVFIDGHVYTIEYH